MKVTFPTGQFIGPGQQMIEIERIEIEEVWHMGHLIHEIEHVIHEEHGVVVPDPGLDGPPEDENSWPARGTFEFADRRWTVVRDDDIGFWGWDERGAPLTRETFLHRTNVKNQAFIAHAAQLGWWDVNGQGEPQKKPRTFSIAALTRENKTLMAHLMVDLGFFKSVGEAKRNGWDKVLELGRHELGPRKKRAFVEIIP